MPKMKTHRAGAKRYKVTGSGKVLRRQAGKSHLLQHKSSKRKNNLSGMVTASETHTDLISKQLPYKSKKYSK